MEKRGWWECPCCGIQYPESLSDQFHFCPNCGLALGDPVPELQEG